VILEAAALAAIAAFAWLWFDTLRAREAAMDAARRACEMEQLQLLDETVALARWNLARNDEGRIAIRREYRFEFSDTGNNRLQGSVMLLGRALQMLHLDPHRDARANLLA
jgi:hypothetical protein